MVKECPVHGRFEDIMSVDQEFLRWIEQNFPGRDIRAHNDEGLHNHGSSSIRHGRGSVLTVDLTNRCNMMCDPCFMDANQVGFVHELSWEEIKEILDNATKIKPRRQMSVPHRRRSGAEVLQFHDGSRPAEELSALPGAGQPGFAGSDQEV
jgi:7,8-dihydro-6-hydroxymethylpterin dimethyltransferase